MKKIRRYSAYIILVISTVVMAGGVILAILELETEATHEARKFRENLFWVVGQFEREARTLRHVLGRFREGDPATSRDDVIERFDVFWSRLETADQGYVGGAVLTLEGAKEAIESTRALLRDMEPVVMNLTRDGRVSLSIRRRLDESVGAFYGLTETVTRWHEERRQFERARIFSLFWKVLFLLTGALLSGGVLVAMFLSRQRSLEALRRTLEERVAERTEVLHREIAEHKQTEDTLRKSETTKPLMHDDPVTPDVALEGLTE